MEFFDTKAKRKHAIKLFLGYGLVAILIGLATTLLVYMAQGYNYNLDDGVVRNGLVFVDSKPVSANVSIDGQPKDKTGARLTLDEGQHTLLLTQDKYRDWTNTFNLEGGGVLYFTYPLMIPTNINLAATHIFDSPPVWASQSPDKRWLVIQQYAASPVLATYDLSNPSQPPTLGTLPSSQLIGRGSQLGALSSVQWANDNTHLLLKQNLSNGGSAYVIFDRENADNSVNLNIRHNLPTTAQINLRDEKYDKYYYLDSASQMLSNLDLQTGLAAAPLAHGVVAYGSYGEDKILYVTYANAALGTADVYALSGQDTFKLKSLPKDSQGHYLLKIDQFDNSWYYLTASSEANQVLMYRNPLKRASPGNTEAINPQMSLDLNDPQYISFSDNSRFVAMQSGKAFVVYDAEQNRVFRYTNSLEIGVAQQTEWMDSYRMKAEVGGKVYIFDFDGANVQELAASQPGFTAYFDEDYGYVYSLMMQADGKVALTSGQLVAE